MIVIGLIDFSTGFHAICPGSFIEEIEYTTGGHLVHSQTTHGTKPTGNTFVEPVPKYSSKTGSTISLNKLLLCLTVLYHKTVFFNGQTNHITSSPIHKELILSLLASTFLCIEALAFVWNLFILNNLNFSVFTCNSSTLHATELIKFYNRYQIYML